MGTEKHPSPCRKVVLQKKVLADLVKVFDSVLYHIITTMWRAYCYRM